MKMFYGTQYYRSPTPLEDEWETDLENMRAFNLDTIQIRINWRTNEKKEGEYDFSDVDKLMELAKKHNKKVVIKFLMECAPQYIFDKYEGTRIGPRGEKIRGGYHGAFYGGWMPCYSNEKIRDRADKFIQEVVKRYIDCDNLILYNAWNEIRNRPMEECFCDNCKNRYHSYLENKFGTIENLNKFYGANEADFESIDFPSTPHGIWDTYEFKKFYGEEINYQKVRMVYDAIRKIDKTRPIMCHVGFTCGFQNDISDVVNDFKVSKAVDFWGTSVPFEQHMDTVNRRLDMQIVNDFVRSVNPHYHVHELYPSLGRYILYDRIYDMEYKIFKSLSRGAKGICFWQYRSERLGHEMDCSGLTYMNGTPREVIKPVKWAGDFIKKYDDFLYNSQPKKAKIAILYDFDSMLLSEIEDNFGPDFKWGLYNPLFHYFKAHQGLYRLISKCDYAVDYISTSDLSKMGDYPLVFVPDLSMLNAEKSKALEDYVSKGGHLILEDGFGLRDENTWINPYDIKTKMFEGWLEFRMKEFRKVIFKGKEDAFGPYSNVTRIKGSKVLSRFDNGEPAIQEMKYGGGKVTLLGFSLGYGAYEEAKPLYKELMDDFALDAGIKKKRYQNFENGIEENRLTMGNEELLFLFNANEIEMKLNIQEEIIETCYKGSLKGNEITIEPQSLSILKIKAR